MEPAEVLAMEAADSSAPALTRRAALDRERDARRRGGRARRPAPAAVPPSSPVPARTRRDALAAERGRRRRGAAGRRAALTLTVVVAGAVASAGAHRQVLAGTLDAIPIAGGDLLRHALAGACLAVALVVMAGQLSGAGTPSAAAAVPWLVAVLPLTARAAVVIHEGTASGAWLIASHPGLVAVVALAAGAGRAGWSARGAAVTAVAVGAWTAAVAVRAPDVAAAVLGDLLVVRTAVLGMLVCAVLVAVRAGPVMQKLARAVAVAAPTGAVTLAPGVAGLPAAAQDAPPALAAPASPGGLALVLVLGCVTVAVAAAVLARSFALIREATAAPQVRLPSGATAGPGGRVRLVPSPRPVVEPAPVLPATLRPNVSVLPSVHPVRLIPRQRTVPAGTDEPSGRHRRVEPAHRSRGEG